MTSTKIQNGEYEITSVKVYRVALNETSKEWHVYAKDIDGKSLGGGWEWSEGGFDTKKEAIEHITTHKF